MKKKAAPTVTDFATDHDGEHAKAVYLAAMETDTFADPVQPLQTYTDLRTSLIRVADQPAKVVPIFEHHTAGMTDAQKLFIAQKVKGYFANTVFREGDSDSDSDSEGIKLTGIVEPLRAYVARLERAMLPKVADMRATLKDLFRTELERLPDALQTLDEKDRLNFLCKLMPFVLPKVEAVTATKGEPDEGFSLW